MTKSEETKRHYLLIDAVREVLDLEPLYYSSKPTTAAEKWMTELAITSEIWLEKEEYINDFWVDPIEEKENKPN